MCREYNGWKNYQTWAINVHGFLDNRDNLDEIAAEAYRDSEGTEHWEKLHDATTMVSNQLVDMLDELEQDARELGLSPMLLDILGAALASVDFRRLAEHVVDDAPDVPHEATPAPAGTK